MAWLRFWPALGDGFVGAVDRNFERLLPLLVRTGLLQWLHRKEYRLMSDGVVPVRLVV